MKIKSPLKQPWRLWLGVALALALPTLIACAQDPFPAPTPAPDPLAGVPVQVLDQQQVTIGDYTITYNRIAPPVFPAPVPPAGSTANAVNHGPQTRRASSSPHTNDADGSGEKPYKVLLLSATVYDHQFTEVRWNNGAAPALRAYLNIDFCYFTTVPNLETADTVYDLMFAWDNDAAASLTQAGQPLPDFSSLPAGHAGYQVFAGDPNAHPDAIAAFSALCAYYDANSAQMIAAYNQRQADNAARQQWLIDHPPVKADTVINYWPVKNSAFLQPKN